MPTPQDILFNALVDIEKIGAGQSAIAATDLPLCLSKFNRRVSAWNAKQQFGMFEYTQVFTLPTAANSYTMGATADSPALVVTAGRAPLVIDSAKRVSTATPPIEDPISVLTFDQWDRISVPGMTTSLTLAVYLQTKPKLPVLWCYGFAAGELLRMSWRSLMNTITIADLGTNIDMQDGYEDALTRTLSEDLAPAFGITLSQRFHDDARESRMNIVALNGKPAIGDPNVPTDQSRGFSREDRFNSRTV